MAGVFVKADELLSQMKMHALSGTRKRFSFPTDITSVNASKLISLAQDQYAIDYRQSTDRDMPNGHKKTEDYWDGLSNVLTRLKTMVLEGWTLNNHQTSYIKTFQTPKQRAQVETIVDILARNGGIQRPENDNDDNASQSFVFPSHAGVGESILNTLHRAKAKTLAETREFMDAIFAQEDVDPPTQSRGEIRCPN